MTLEIRHRNYIQHTLVPQILQNACFAGHELVDSNVTSVRGLDGFMSAIHQLEQRTRKSNDQNRTITATHMIVKLMKGDEQFRNGTKSYTQFANEIYYYTRIQPCFEQMLADSRSSIAFENITPKVYSAFFGRIPELGPAEESVLAIHDLRPHHFRGGPRLTLDESHLRLLVEQIARFHAMSYGLKIQNAERWARLIDGIIEMPFRPSGREGDTTNQFVVLYGIAFERFFGYVRRTAGRRSARFLADVDRLERRYGAEPVALMERLRRRDDNAFSVIQHGDYNRNNVLFRYDAAGEAATTADEPVDIRMIDFQELRYGSPAFDLTFFMYISCDPKSRPLLWDKLLAHYHETMIATLATIVGCGRDDDILGAYRYDAFLDHLSQFAFYGVMICLQFLPCMMCSEADCDRMTKLFDENMYGQAYREAALVVGGDEADERLADIVEHASTSGYMTFMQDQSG